MMNSQEKGVPGVPPGTPNSQLQQSPHIVPTPTVGNLDETEQTPAAGATATPRPTPSGEGEPIGQPAGTLPPTLETLRHVRCWLLWRLDTATTLSNGKHPKIPYYANGRKRSGGFLTPEDTAQLVTFDEVCAAHTARPDFYTGGGIVSGFEVGPDKVVQGLDFDGLDIEHLKESANNLKGYAEVSPSGAGLRAIGIGRKFDTLTNQGTGIEGYCNGQFLTVTFNTCKDEGVTDLYDFVRDVIAPLRTQRMGKTSADSAGMGVESGEYLDPKTITELRSALNAIPADDYHVWNNVGLALKPYGNIGYELWLTWSQKSDKYDPKRAAKKWANELNGTRSSYAAVFALAQNLGWINPNSNEARGGDASAPPEDELVTLDSLEVDLAAEDDDEVPDIVADLVADEEVTLLGGHGGGGKSFLAIQIACAVAMGRPVLGKVTRRSRVLFYAAEDGKKRLRRRVRKIAEAENYDLGELNKWLKIIDASELDPLYGDRLETSGKNSFKKVGPLYGYDRLRAKVEAFDPQLVIIDGASDTFDGNEIARRDVRGFVKALRRIHPKRPIGAMINAHIDRSSARGNVSSDDGYAGSAAWHNSCRRRLYLQVSYDRDNKDDDGRPVVLGTTLRVMKNQDGPPAPDMEVERDEHGFWRLAVQYAGNLDPNGYRKSDTQIAEELSSAVLDLIENFYERGIWMSTSLAPNSTTNVPAVLAECDELPPALKGKKGKGKLLGIVRRLNLDGWLVAESYTAGTRHKGDRWRVDRLRGGHVVA